MRGHHCHITGTEPLEQAECSLPLPGRGEPSESSEDDDEPRRNQRLLRLLFRLVLRLLKEAEPPGATPRPSEAELLPARLISPAVVVCSGGRALGPASSRALQAFVRRTVW